MNSRNDAIRSLPKSLKMDFYAIEEIIRTKARSSLPLMDSMVSSLVKNGGKRIRPLILMVVFRGMNGKVGVLEQAYRSAASLELIHTATLIHDDLIDKSHIRRGIPTIYARHGIPSAVLAGDYLFVEAYALTAGLPVKLVDNCVGALRKMAEGQLLEETIPQNELDFKTYLDIISSKTAVLFKSACESGALLADSDQTQVDMLGCAGLSLGIAFQFIDDILDVLGNEKITGKPIGSDFLSGKMTLPYFLYQDSFGPLPHTRTQKTFQSILNKLTSDSVITKGKEMALSNTNKAKELFHILKNREIRTYLLNMCDQMLNRIL
ncbi:MAG TPA: polyprenyl synthetase family protein [Candidatus Marinimicrobia bacterium]|nr:polyprenyl synthetase family protein [Candidatus Neomarinimicrobiota bacterium]